MTAIRFTLSACAGAAALSIALTSAASAACPAVTLADMKGVGEGKYPQQYELSEFESMAGCKLSFSGNPAAKKLNARIQGNPSLPSVGDRLPDEPLVVAPYDSIGKYGGVFDALSNATEAGTSDFLSTRHVNLVRYADDLQTIVPNVAKDWEWNSDYTQLTFFLRKGHRWSDGAPFTAEDVKFWYDNLALDPNVIEKAKDYVLVAGERMTVDVVNPQTVRFNLPAPKPGLLAHFATSYAQGFQPKHYLGQFHPAISSDADAKAKKLGFENGYAVIMAYYGNSDWTDTPSPLLANPDLVGKMPKAVMPTLEAFLTIADTTEGRHYVANPYFFMVDTQGNQLPYINEQDEVYINENEVRLLKLVNGEVDYKSQSVTLPAAPMLMDGADKGGYNVQLKPNSKMSTFSFNLTSENLEKRKVFGNVKFREAMSIAINRDEINEVAYFGLGTPLQYTLFSPNPDFVDDKWPNHMIGYAPDKAKKMLDEIGVVDKDGDGMRDLLNGDKFVLDIQFATQGVPGPVVELVAQHWTNVGVQTTFKEVTPDEYRSNQSSNKLDIGVWEMGLPLSLVLGLNENFIPPYGNYFDIRTGMLWAEYLESDGAKGVKPPDWSYKMIDDINGFQSAAPGSSDQARLGAALVENLTGHMVMIGTVLSPSPIYHRNALKNFPEFKMAAYDYYRTFPYRPQQWWFDE
ncbi:MAG: ABC transporter substrate-binding protein [Rhodospirillales bacterium]